MQVWMWRIFASLRKLMSFTFPGLIKVCCRFLAWERFLLLESLLCGQCTICGQPAPFAIMLMVVPSFILTVIIASCCQVAEEKTIYLQRFGKRKRLYWKTIPFGLLPVVIGLKPKLRKAGSCLANRLLPFQIRLTLKSLLQQTKSKPACRSDYRKIGKFCCLFLSVWPIHARALAILWKLSNGWLLPVQNLNNAGRWHCWAVMPRNWPTACRWIPIH